MVEFLNQHDKKKLIADWEREALLKVAMLTMATLFTISMLTMAIKDNLQSF